MTIKDIARLAGVSISTVSKIVNNKDENINGKTRNRVLSIVKEYNYTPYGMVKNLSTSKTFILGVLLGNAAACSTLLQGITQKAQELGYSIMLYDSGNCKELELKHITSLCRQKIDGIIWEPLVPQSNEHAHYFDAQQIPFISANDFQDPSSCFPDFSQMGYLLTQKLLAKQHTKIACLLKEDNELSNQVLSGVRKCFFDNQIPFSEQLCVCDPDLGTLTDLVQNGCTAIISTHYVSALRLYDELHKLHLFLPEDLSLITLLDSQDVQTIYPAISGIVIPYLEFGKYICESIINMCEKKDSSPFIPTFLFHEGDTLGALWNPYAKNILVVGSLNMDITFHVDELPLAGKTTLVKSSAISLGGKGANQAIGAARLGSAVSLIGNVGNDPDAMLIYETLEKEKVSANGVARDSQSQTGKAYIYIRPDGESTITILPGANATLSKEDIQLHEHLFHSGDLCLLTSEIPLATLIAASRTAKKHGSTVLLKPAAMTSVSDELLQNIDIFIPNREESSTLCPHLVKPEEQADYFLLKGPSVIIITMGHNGCYLASGKTKRFFPATNTHVSDTTGGADAFISALAAYLAKDYDLEWAIKIATYAAGFCVARQGIIPALVDLHTLESHIRKLEPTLLI